jgi:hypothetical protein
VRPSLNAKEGDRRPQTAASVQLTRMPIETEFFRWYISDEVSGRRRLTRYAMTRAETEPPGAGARSAATVGRRIRTIGFSKSVFPSDLSRRCCEQLN